MAASRGARLAEIAAELEELRRRAPRDVSLPLEERIVLAKEAGEDMLAAALSRDLRARDRPLTEDESEELDRQRREEVWDNCIRIWEAEDAAALAAQQQAVDPTVSNPDKETAR